MVTIRRLATLIAVACLSGHAFASFSQTVQYPATAAASVVEDHFGVPVADPYRWLEQDIRSDARVREWVAKQNALTESYLSSIPGREDIRTLLAKTWNFSRPSLPRLRGKSVFFLRADALRNQPALYVRSGTGEPVKLIDPNDWAADGATALADWEPSPDGTKIFYSVQDGGSEWRTLHIFDVATREVRPDTLRWAQSTSLAWAPDGSGVYYARFPAPPSGEEHTARNLDHRIYFHRLGTDQDADILVFSTPDRPKLTHDKFVVQGGRWLVILSTEDDTKYAVSVADVASPHPSARTVFRYADRYFGFAGAVGDLIYLVTDDQAPRRRIIAFDASSRETELGRTVVPEGKGIVHRAAVVGGKLIVTTMEDAKHVVHRFSLDGRDEGVVSLPGMGQVRGFSGGDGTTTFYSFESFNEPLAIYGYDVAANRSWVVERPETSFKPSNFEVKQVFYRSKDGTSVPMFISHKKGLDLSHGAPTLLYAYGGFDVSMLPMFSVPRLAWMEMGGLFVQANIRGGGEYGKKWHDDGKLGKKQNVFDDFIAAAENLIERGYTTKEQLAIEGRSNGGLLISAVVNQRPDLFAAALPQVAVTDMVRFTRFGHGRYWTGDYGDPEVEAEFRNLIKYSPYHNIRSGLRYPAIMVATGDTDDLVVPSHSFKYAAALQAADPQGQPHLLRVEPRVGHGVGKPVQKSIDEYTDMWAFIAYHTGLRFPPSLAAERKRQATSPN